MTAEAVIDTSVLVDAMIAEAEGHARARNLLTSMSRMRIPTIVLYEVVWVLKRLGFEPERVEQVVGTLTQNPRAVVEVDEGHLSVRALRMVVEEESSLANFDDKVILSTALKLGLPLATYDAELRKEAKKVKVQTLG